MVNWKDQVIEMLLPAQVAALDASIQPNESSRGYTPFTAQSNTIGVNGTEHMRQTISAKSKSSRMDSPRKSASLRESLASAKFQRPISEELRNSAKEREGAFRQMVYSSHSQKQKRNEDKESDSSQTKQDRSKVKSAHENTNRKTIGNQEFTMDMIGSAHFLISDSAESKRTRSTSAPPVIENNALLIEIAYPKLQVLILERNKIISPEIFDVLAILPK